ncbi:microtubule-associated proteins 1A/1B light chain 3C-like [Tribolium madens]|uniref:microtubule-associated proteins 1A/1B light chain 3C-like n=1 Tax=Tribolium madens TaxID=41895 RepID=UPI001CF7662B|nr:microtubule-associated proteins 1A/1B light chain 3C-like [Tribolium madens]XP_044261396.1 microtubule-associated proteins 1A/1B light chain 3C-like [Tribolium madens]
MYLSDSSELFAYKCENNNSCPFKVMNGRITDVNFNSHRCGAKKTEMGDSDSSGEVRSEEVLALRIKFPTKVPIIIKRYAKEMNLPHLDKCKFLVPQEITVSQFQTIIRNRLQLGPNHALYLLVNNRSMVSLSLTLAEVYSEHAGPDGFLYITYASQEVFGSA